MKKDIPEFTKDDQVQLGKDVEVQAIRILYRQCIKTPDFLIEFNRLTGCDIGRSKRRTPIQQMVDDAVGMDGEREEDFVKLTKHLTDMWSRLDEATKEDLRQQAFAELLEEACENDPELIKIGDGKWSSVWPEEFK